GSHASGDTYVIHKMSGVGFVVGDRLVADVVGGFVKHLSSARQVLGEILPTVVRHGELIALDHVEIRTRIVDHSGIDEGYRNLLTARNDGQILVGIGKLKRKA